MQLTNLSSMPADFNSGLVAQTCDDLENALRDDKIEIIEGEDWNKVTRENTKSTYSLPNAIVPLSSFIEIKGQEINSSCGGAALTALAEREHFASTKQIVRFCIWPTYMLGQMYTGRQLYGKDGGVVPSDVIKVGVRDGFLPVEVARKALDPKWIKKWNGDIYPRGYWTGRGNFEAAAHQAYADACNAYAPLMKNEKIRKLMRRFVMPSVVRFRKSSEVVEAENRQSAFAMECHAWTESCDSDPNRIPYFDGHSKGGQHAHHATYICGLNRRKELLKANSWRPEQLLIQAKEQNSQELHAEEWGDDGVKAWDMGGHNMMMRHAQSYCYGFSGMKFAATESRLAKLDPADMY